MLSDLKRIIDQISRDRGFDKQLLVEAIEEAVASAARKKYGSRRDIEVHSANMHLIPATQEIARSMGRARKGHIVAMKGYLVHATGANGWHWKSSLTRDDTGAGACELVFVESFELR